MTPLLFLFAAALVPQDSPEVAADTAGSTESAPIGEIVDAEEVGPTTATPDRAPEYDRPLSAGLSHLAALRLDEASEALEKAHALGPYSLDDVVVLYHALGIVRAYLGNEAGSRLAFDRLLATEPGHALAYTTSPKATFLFQQAKEAAASRRSPEIRLLTPAVVRLDEPIDFDVMLVADPLAQMKRVEIKHRRKGDDEFTKIVVTDFSTGEVRRFQLPAISSDDAPLSEAGDPGVLLEIAVSAIDDRGWEIYRGPSEARPHELPVGFDAPGPWFTSWWFLSAVGAGVAVTAAVVSASVAAIVFAPLPENYILDPRLVDPDEE